jgi:hypothetical protein
MHIILGSTMRFVSFNAESNNNRGLSPILPTIGQFPCFLGESIFARLCDIGMGYAELKSKQNMAMVMALWLEKFRNSYCAAYESATEHYFFVKHKSRQL